MSIRFSRQFSLISLSVIVILTVVFGALYRSIAISELKQQVALANTHLTQLIEHTVLAEIKSSHSVESELFLHNFTLDNKLFKKLDKHIRGMGSGGMIVKVKLFNLAGFVVYSTEKDEIGNEVKDYEEFVSAKKGVPASEMGFYKEIISLDGATVLKNRDILSTYVPVRFNDNAQVMGVFELYTDATEKVLAIRRMEYVIYGAVSLLFLTLYIFLYVYVRKAECILEEKEKDLDKKKKEELFFATNYDELTNLPNRSRFLSELDTILCQCKSGSCAVAVLIVNIDRMDWVNNYGENFGNKVIEKTANYLKLSLREKDALYRIDGNEFGIILDCTSRKQQAKIIADRIHEYFKEPIAIDEREVHVGLSIGIAISPDDSDKKDELIAYAASAMHRAKDIGGNISMFYSHYINRLSMQRYELETELRKSLNKGQFEVFYQPKIDMQQFRVVGAEALVRWNHPDKGFIQPDEFIKTLESTGFIIPVGEWVLEQACQQCKCWHDIGFDELTVAVNISAKQFNSDLLLQTKTILYESGLPSKFLELEITESVLADNINRAIDILASMKQSGIKLSIDDFGTGYSSLSYLASFPVDNLKVDKMFVNDITENKRNASITETIIAMAKSLEMGVIVEGVETEEQREYLCAIGCRIAQGFLFSKPVSADEFIKILESGQFKGLKARVG